MIIETDLSKVTPTSHRFVGMFRPQFSEVLDKRRSCGYELRFEAQQKLRLDWLAGHFDTPQYERIVPEDPELDGPESETPQPYADRTRLSDADAIFLSQLAASLRITANGPLQPAGLAFGNAVALEDIVRRGTAP